MGLPFFPTGSADAAVTVPATRAITAAADRAPANSVVSFRIPLPPVCCPPTGPARSRCAGKADMPITTLPVKTHRDKGTLNVGKVISKRLNDDRPANKRLRESVTEERKQR